MRDPWRGWRARRLVVALLGVFVVGAAAVVAIGSGLVGGRLSDREINVQRAALKPTSGEREESGDESKELRAREAWFYGQRSFPAADTPPGAMMRAQAQARGLGRDIAAPPGESKPDAAHIAPTSPLTWTSLGPRPIAGGAPSEYNGTAPWSGRVTALAHHPTNADIAYLGGAAGGVWKTVNAGAPAADVRWTPVFDAQPSLAIGAIAIDPTNPNTIYAGTGESNFNATSYFGTGIYRSTNGGTTWAKIGGTRFDRCHVSDIVVKPGTSTTLLVAVQYYGRYETTCDSGVHRSLNGGAGWTRVAQGLATDLAVKPGSPTVWYAAFYYDGVHKSTNSGGTWTPLGGGLPTSGAGRIALATTAANPARVYAAVEDTATSGTLGVWATADNGVTWTQLSYSNFCGYSNGYGYGQCSYDLAVAADPASQQHVYAGGVRLQRHDGTGWSTLGYGTSGIHVDIHAVGFDAANRLWVGSDGGVYRRDAGATGFANLNGTLSLTQFYPGTAGSVASGRRFVGGTQDNGTLSFERATSAWYEFATGDGGYSAIDPANPNVIYSSYVYATAFKSTDGGATSPCIFTALASYSSYCTFYTSDPTNFVTPLVMDPANAQRLYIGTSRVWRTTTGGASWSGPASGLFGGTISAIGVPKSSASTLYAAWQSDPTVLRRTANAGAASPTWTPTAALPNRVVTDIEVDPRSAATVYATLSGFDESTPGKPGHVFRSTNSGGTWTNVSGNLPNTPVNALAVDTRTTPATLYAGTDVGVFWSVDGGASWANTSRGLPNTVVSDVRVDLITNKLIAATHGRGAYTVQVASPAISGLTPASGRTGASVTITGRGFTGATSVKFNGRAATFTVVSPTQITATVPNAARTGPVTVTTGAGTAQSPGNFTVTLSITGFAPASGPAGTTVTVSGVGFTGATAVRFNGVAAPFTVVSGSTIRATVPAAATTGRITVTTPAGTVTSATGFTKT